MPNVVRVVVENPNDIRNAGMYDTGAIVRVQSSATEAGAYADLTGTGSTPTIPVVADTRSYSAYDPNGTGSTWYRTRYENAAATRLSDWSSAFQVGGEEAGQICSLDDVEQRLTGAITANNRELLLEFIRDATTDIEGYTGRWFVPRPVSGTATYVFSPRSTSRTLRIPKGIRSVTSLGYATTDQPDSGGSYTAIATTDISLQPGPAERDAGWPATKIVILDSSGALFYGGINRVQVVGGFGWSAPPADIAGIGANVVIGRFGARGSGVRAAAGSDDFAGRLLRWVSPEERAKLDWYRAGRI